MTEMEQIFLYQFMEGEKDNKGESEADGARGKQDEWMEERTGL